MERQPLGKCCVVPRLTKEKAHKPRRRSHLSKTQSNGFIERSIQTIKRQVGALKLALENCIGRKSAADSCVILWLVEHAGNILGLFEVGSDGRSPC